MVSGSLCPTSYFDAGLLTVRQLVNLQPDSFVRWKLRSIGLSVFEDRVVIFHFFLETWLYLILVDPSAMLSDKRLILMPQEVMWLGR